MRHSATRRHLLSAPLALAGAVLLGDSRARPAQRDDTGEPAEPAASATPAAMSGSRRRAILTAPYQTLPPAPAAITLTRIQLPPHGAAAGEGAAGPRLIVVESQTIAVAPAGIGLVERAAVPGSSGSDGAKATPVPTSGELVLAVGDGLVSDAPPHQLRNDGERPASLLIAEVVALPTGQATGLPVPVAGAPSPLPVAPSSLYNPNLGFSTPAADAPSFNAEALPIRPFLTDQGVLVEPLAGGVALALPAGPGEIRFDRLALPAGWDEPLPAQPGPWLLLVESGQMGLATETGTILYRSAAAVNPSTVPGRAKRIAPGSEVLLTAGGMAFVYPEAEVALRNRGRTTLAVLALAVVPNRRDVVIVPPAQI